MVKKGTFVGFKGDDRPIRLQAPSPRGRFGGLIPPNTAPSPPNWNIKHYKIVEFLINLNVKPPCTNAKPPAQM